MTPQNSLKWEDLISPTLTPDEYLEKYGNNVKEVYDNYEPKSEIIEDIKNILKDKKEKMRIVVLGADWCPDCSKNVPRMIKIAKELNSNDFELKILYGIMKNALHKPEETIWHKKRSPPEATDPKFALKAIPTFYFFNKSGDYLGTIVENPEYKSTLEEDTLKILKRYL
ncbi:MAG: thioredoxin family protein [Candidatus Hermodarchaeota archaeon]